MSSTTEFDEVFDLLKREARRLGVTLDPVKNQMMNYYQKTVSEVTGYRSDRVFVLVTVGYFALEYAKIRGATRVEERDFFTALMRFKPIPPEPDKPFCKKSVEKILKNKRMIKNMLYRASSKEFELFIERL